MAIKSTVKCDEKLILTKHRPSEWSIEDAHQLADYITEFPYVYGVIIRKAGDDTEAKVYSRDKQCLEGALLNAIREGVEQHALNTHIICGCKSRGVLA